MREHIYNIIEKNEDRNKKSIAYDILMLIAITASIVPLMYVNNYPVFKYIELVTIVLFILDYILRWLTADYKLNKGLLSFLIYPFTIWAIIDLLSILPGLSVLSKGFKIFRVTTYVCSNICDTLIRFKYWAK